MSGWDLFQRVYCITAGGKAPKPKSHNGSPPPFQGVCFTLLCPYATTRHSGRGVPNWILGSAVLSRAIPVSHLLPLYGAHRCFYPWAVCLVLQRVTLVSYLNNAILSKATPVSHLSTTSLWGGAILVLIPEQSSSTDGHPCLNLRTKTEE